MGLLSDIRVLELSAAPTMLAGRMLADFGADVVTVEPPAGAAGRRLDPFVDGVPGLERSLTWQALNYGKRGMTLDWSRPDGRALLRDLAPRFDVVLEACEPGTPNVFAEGELPTRLVRCLITPFSKEGPKARYRYNDLIVMAASGAPYLAGEPDRPPLFFPTRQAMMEAGAEAAVVTIAALLARNRDGLGQEAEVSQRTAAMAGALGRIIGGFAGDTLPVRSKVAGGALAGTVAGPSMYRCRDGYVFMHVLFGASPLAAMTFNMIRWAITEGALAPEYGQFDWRQYGKASTNAPTGPMEALVHAITVICARSTKFDIIEASRTQSFMAAPVMTMEDIENFPHYRERGLFAQIPARPGGRALQVPARFVQLSNDSIEISRPAPMLSEHTTEILTQELGLSSTEVQALFVHEVI
jgi:crotonobetainyl-CoA:carnitine CoA-transferase CaiB-like acyl-CoA transferase